MKEKNNDDIQSDKTTLVKKKVAHIPVQFSVYAEASIVHYVVLVHMLMLVNM